MFFLSVVEFHISDCSWRHHAVQYQPFRSRSHIKRRPCLQEMSASLLLITAWTFVSDKLFLGSVCSSVVRRIMNPPCGRCNKPVYPTEKINCLDKVRWLNINTNHPVYTYWIVDYPARERFKSVCYIYMYINTAENF